MYIASQDELEAFVARAATSSVLAIDTEFLREKTYYPKLCLLQMATDDEIVIVDPFAVDDLAAITPLLENPAIMKVLHSARQDLEIILLDIGCLPTPVFDTQMAAALLGQTQQIGYAALVHSVCGVKLKKADSFTDWSARPLTESQINYASEDVEYLPELYRSLTDVLMSKGRLHWLDSDFADLSRPETFLVDERLQYRRLKHAGSLSRRQTAAAREMAAWREITARKRNIPRKWVLTDEQIVEVCKREPHTIDDMFMVRGIRDRLSTADARTLLALIRSALDAPPDTWPEAERTNHSEKNVDAQVDLLMCLVRLRARENDVAIPTLASHSDLVAIARGHYDDVDILRGWRYDIVGAELLDLLEGRITLSIQDGNVTLGTAII